VFETKPNDDRMILAKVGFVLAAVILIAILATRNLFLMLAHPGGLPRPSFRLIAIAISCLALIPHSLASTFRTKKLLVLAFALAGGQAAVRAALWLAKSPHGWQVIAAFGGEVFTTVAAIIVASVVFQWLTSENREQPPPGREKSLS
jgi:hypothetical protein